MTLSNKVHKALDKDTIQEMDKLCDRLRTGVEFQDNNVLWETHLIQLESFARLFTSQVTPLQNYQVFTWDTVKKVVCRTHVAVCAYDISFNTFRNRYCPIGKPLPGVDDLHHYVLAPCNTEDLGWTRDVMRAFHKQFEGGCDESPTIPQQIPEAKENPEYLYE